ncbi:alpha/beta fold hydrolase [soil metagenome]
MNSSGGLRHVMRPAASEPAGVLVLFHGRGADEHDLYPLFDLLDPERRLLGVCPRGPLSLPPGGAHWYVVRRVGYPDAATFCPTYAAAAAWLDELLGEGGIPLEKTVLGGFSQGAVMSYALGLGSGRPRPAGLMCFSGFIPEVEGFEPDLTNACGLPIAIGHGTGDPVIEVTFSRRARAALEEAGAEVTYRESDMGHSIDPGYLAELRTWLTQRFERPSVQKT